MQAKIFTAADARDEKRNAELPALAAAKAAAAEARRIADVLARNPEIGILGHGRARIYYAHVNGYAAGTYASKEVGDVARKLEDARR